VLAPRVVPHFDNHALAGRPMFMDDNSRQLRVNGKNNPRQLHPIPKSSCAKMWLSCNEVFRWRQTIARPSVGRSKKRLSSEQWTRLHVIM
jgi:hypothetical protein